ncbi:MAG: hypothetical protein ACQEVA_22090 [Myxococcota bacterium]
MLLALATAVPLSACDEDGTGADVDASQVGDANSDQKKLEPKDDEKAEETAKTPDRTEASSKNAGTVKQTPPLAVDEYFKMQDVTALSEGGLRTTPLAGQESTEDYNSLRIHPAGRADYGAAVQLWKLEDASAAADRVAEMRKQYLSVSDPAEDAPVKDRSAFLSTRQNMWQYVFNPKGEPYVAAVSCEEKFCRDVKVVYEIGSKVNNRILTEDQEQAKKEKAPTPKKAPAPKKD